jgi:predicted protein tyrosine phosphatase
MTPAPRKDGEPAVCLHREPAPQPDRRSRVPRLSGVEAAGAGTNADADAPLSGDLIAWADGMRVMEKIHRNKVAKKYQDLLKSLICLDVADRYDYMPPKPVRLLEVKVAKVPALTRAPAPAAGAG